MIEKGLFLKKKDVWGGYVLLLYILICVYFVGTKSISTWGDYEVYKNYYHNAITFDVTDIILNVQDPAFVLFMKFFTGSRYGFENFLLFIAFLTLFLKMFSVFRRVDKIYIFILLYSSYYLCLHDYIQVRISFALALVCVGMYVFPGRKISLLFIITGCFVHLSTIIPVAIYYISNRSENAYKRLYLLIPFIIIVPLGFSYGYLSYYRIDRYLNYYSELNDKKGGVLHNMPLLIPMLQAIGLAYIYIREKTRGYIYTFEYAVSYVGILIYYSCISMPVIAIRVFDISTFFFIILISKMKYNAYTLLFIVGFTLINIRNTLILLGYNIPFFHLGT